MPLTLKNQVALVTGGSRGIGRAIVEKLASAGCHLAIHYFNSSDKAQNLCEQVRNMGLKAITLQGNVGDPDSVREMFEEFKRHFDQIDILVSNAATGVLKPLSGLTLKHWRWCMEVNALALNLLVQSARPLMKRGTRCLAITSLGSTRAIPHYAFVGASKAALEALVRSLSVELASEGITVNSVSSGLVDTEALRHFPNRNELISEFSTRALTQTLIDAKDVADVVYLLCQPEAQMIRGQTIHVDAGYSIVS